ncbi:MAG: PAS domain-containing protein [Proteobacteria bacterium]|nr:PAS domain-containing protein [Pseudomonadota bacterium]
MVLTAMFPPAHCSIKTANFAIITDISERMRQDAQIGKLHKVVEQSPVGVIITDARGTIEYVNPHLCDLTGYSSAEFIGQNPRLLHRQ